MYFCSNLMFLSYFLSFQIISEWEMGKGAVAVFLMDNVSRVGVSRDGCSTRRVLSDGRSPSHVY